MRFYLEAIVLLVASIGLLRVAGKKSVSQMTPAETITILAIGTTMGHAIAESGLFKTLLVLSIFVMVLLLVQFVQLKSNFFENLFVGRATLVIYEGQIVREGLKKLRMTQNQLETRLRQKGISYITDVKTATIETNGELGFELMKHAKPITLKDLQELQQIQITTSESAPNSSNNIFDKIIHDHFQNKEQGII